MFAEGYEHGMMKKGLGGKGKSRAGIGRAVHLRAQTPHSKPHGGHTGHHTGHPGPYAAHPHNGMHASPNHGMSHMGMGRHAAPPHDGKLARATGYGKGGVHYAAAGPQQGFITGARGNFRGVAPGGQAGGY
jgi:hypothetical protein